MKHTPTLFFCAVLLSSWFGGVGPGIFAGLLSALALDYYFVSPLNALGIRSEEAPDMIAFLASAWFISWLSGKQRRAEDALRQARDELRQANERLQAEIAEHKLAQESLSRAQAEAARAGRIIMMGELAASGAGLLQRLLCNQHAWAEAEQ